MSTSAPSWPRLSGAKEWWIAWPNTLARTMTGQRGCTRRNHYGVPFINTATARPDRHRHHAPYRVDPVTETQARSNRPGLPRQPPDNQQSPSAQSKCQFRCLVITHLKALYLSLASFAGFVMSTSSLRLVRLAPDPLGLYVRAGRLDQKDLQSFISSGSEAFTGVVFEATHTDRGMP